MLTDIIMDRHRGWLADALAGFSAADVAPLAAAPDVAKSALQKGIRRGDTGLALRATARLLQASPQSFWRRLRVIAFEDVGIADLDAVAQAVVGASTPNWRRRVGGDWTVASWLVQRLATSVKDRSADDLAVIITYDPATLPARLRIAQLDIGHRLALSADPDGGLVERAVAAWWTTGARGYPLEAIPGPADPTGYFDRLFDAGVSPTAVAIARTGFRATRLVLPVLLPLLIQSDAYGASEPETENPPAVPPVSEIPGYVLDLYTRPGRRAIRAFLARNDRVRRALVDLGVPPAERAQTLGGILFRLESAHVDRRLRWETGRRLRHRADRCWLQADPSAIDAAFDLVRADIPHLNAIRREVADGSFR